MRDMNDMKGKTFLFPRFKVALGNGPAEAIALPLLTQ
jgi:hypothetical protein